GLHWTNNYLAKVFFCELWEDWVNDYTKVGVRMEKCHCCNCSVSFRNWDNEKIADRRSSSHTHSLSPICTLSLTHTHTCSHTNTHTHTHSLSHTHAHTPSHTCTNTNTNANTHTHTHTQTHTFSSEPVGVSS